METKLIYERMVKVMKAVSGIAKTRNNAQQGFKFRGIDDVYNMIHEVLADNDIFMTKEILAERTEERTTQKGNNLIYRVLTIRYCYATTDGSRVYSESVGEAMDSGDKAANKGMAVAHKYCLTQDFCIPTEDLKDSDATTPEESTPKKEPDILGKMPPPKQPVMPPPKQPVMPPPATNILATGAGSITGKIGGVVPGAEKVAAKKAAGTNWLELVKTNKKKAIANGFEIAVDEWLNLMLGTLGYNKALEELSEIEGVTLLADMNAAKKTWKTDAAIKLAKETK